MFAHGKWWKTQSQLHAWRVTSWGLIWTIWVFGMKRPPTAILPGSQLSTVFSLGNFQNESPVWGIIFWLKHSDKANSGAEGVPWYDIDWLYFSLTRMCVYECRWCEWCTYTYEYISIICFFVWRIQDSLQQCFSSIKPRCKCWGKPWTSEVIKDGARVAMVSTEKCTYLNIQETTRRSCAKRLS